MLVNSFHDMADDFDAQLAGNVSWSTGPSEAHEQNMDAADREIARRAAEGEDMSQATIDPVTYAIIKPSAAKVYVQNCPKCRGSGRYSGPSSRGRHCFKCGGNGKLEFKTSEEDRAKARASAAARKVNRADADWSQFVSTYPVEGAWIQERRESFGFAASMYEAVRKFGDLTERQLAAVQRCVVSDADRAEKRAADAVERAKSEASAPQVASNSLEKLMAAFASSKAAGIKYPKIRLADFVFNPAPDTGKNAGAIYVKSREKGDDGQGVYLGKIAGGAFLKSRDCDEKLATDIAAAASDPEAAAIAFGRKFGACSICARELTDKDSIARGIGPICAERMGW